MFVYTSSRQDALPMRPYVTPLLFDFHSHFRILVDI